MVLVEQPLGLWKPRLCFPLTVAAIAGSAAASAAALVTVVHDDAPLRYFLGGWPPPLGIEYVVDHLSAFVAVIVTSVALLVIIATRRAAEEAVPVRRPAYYGMVLLLLAGLTGIVVTGDLFNLFVFLEIASLAAYTLVFIGERRAMVAGFRYLILGTIGGALYLLGVGFLYFNTGTLNMADTARLLPEMADSRSIQAAAVLIFTGLGLKMALFPLHLWLPDAYTYSPSSVSSLIAPIMTKVGAYAMLRMFISVFSPAFLRNEMPVADVLVLLGLIGVVFGSVAAMSQKDLRRMLAYSSISQISMIGIGIGLATPLAFVAAMLHVMNHAVMKASLFLSAASVRRATGSSQVADLAGMGRYLPVTMVVFTVGAIGMIGIPPTAGFFSKWYLIQAAIEFDQWLVVAVVLLSSLLTAVYMFRVLERVYLHRALGEQEPTYDGHAIPAIPTVVAMTTIAQSPTETVLSIRESPADMLVPMIVLASATVVLGAMNVIIVSHVLEQSL
jgi:multicomponent Na+:H+ antiporter subunit D